MARAQATTNHDKIRKWVESRGGHPSAVKATRKASSPGGLLRIDFDPRDEGLQEIGWEEFFKTFDGSELAFLYQEKTADGHISRFFKFVDRDTLDEQALSADEDEEEEDENEDEEEDEDLDEDEDDEDWDDEDDEDMDDDEDEAEEPPSKSSKKKR